MLFLDYDQLKWRVKIREDLNKHIPTCCDPGQTQLLGFSVHDNLIYSDWKCRGCKRVFTQCMPA